MNLCWLPFICIVIDYRWGRFTKRPPYPESIPTQKVKNKPTASSVLRAATKDLESHHQEMQKQTHCETIEALRFAQGDRSRCSRSVQENKHRSIA